MFRHPSHFDVKHTKTQMFNHEIIPPKDEDGLTNSEDSNLTAPLADGPGRKPRRQAVFHLS